ncbi:MAG: HD-GYP domain-containing protein [Planctomycetota bacterium]|nr:HD-GYP domain-containing protein [Planctomycetota bacterium]
MSPDIVQALVSLLEAKDMSTGAHTWRVVLYTRALAERAGVDHAVIARLTTAAALHDVGKIDVPHWILRKPGPLTDDERAEMQRHTVYGHERLQRMGETDDIVLDLVRHHHERWDGTGYPDRLKGEEISVGARFFAVIDAFDAMTSIRPYRQDVGEQAAERALAEIARGRGTHYCPEAADFFAGLYRSGALDWILHYFNDEAPVPDLAGLHELPAAMARRSVDEARPSDPA